MGLAGFVLLSLTLASQSASGLELGQRWQYKHEGPRCGSIEPNVIDGERIIWVVGQGPGAGDQGSGSGPWVIEERFTRDPQGVGRLYVDPAGLLIALEIENQKGEKARLRYDPPVPYRPTDMGLEVGQTKTLETTLHMDSPSFALPNKTLVERLGDETVSTPAGEFPGCQHFRSTTQSTFDIKIAKVPMTEEREQWFHPSTQAMVKEVYRKGPVKLLTWSRPGYTATSTLMAVGKERPDSSDIASVQTYAERSDPQKPPSSPSKPDRLRLGEVFLVGMAALVAALVWVRQARHDRGTKG
jgi:hypothetical protein